MARVVSVNISDKKGVVKHPVPEINCRKDFGVENDAHAGKGIRQISYLAQESVDKMTAMGVKGLTPGKFAENVTTEGIVLHTLPVGTYLAIGETIQRVSKIGKECHAGCAIKQQVGMCIMPTEGIFTQVICGGKVRPGDAIRVLQQNEAAEVFRLNGDEESR